MRELHFDAHVVTVCERVQVRDDLEPPLRTEVDAGGEVAIDAIELGLVPQEPADVPVALGCDGRHRMTVLHLEREDVLAEPRPQARLHVLRS